MNVTSRRWCRYSMIVLLQLREEKLVSHVTAKICNETDGRKHWLHVEVASDRFETVQ